LFLEAHRDLFARVGEPVGLIDLVVIEYGDLRALIFLDLQTPLNVLNEEGLQFIRAAKVISGKGPWNPRSSRRRGLALASGEPSPMKRWVNSKISRVFLYTLPR
jgi:hypothetical protein